MPTPLNSPSPSPGPTQREQAWVVLATLITSIGAVIWSARHSAFLLYGDAEAHIHIARRLFDSHRPGITQLGSVWLPLPHLLLVPFVAVTGLWRSGLAAAIPSAACYVLGCLGLYRLARQWLAIPAACIALVFYAANPNLLYLQTTAMTEPLFLCELIWTVLLLVNWYRALDRNRAGQLWPLIAVLVAAVYTRYDGWILAFLAWAIMAVCLYRRRRLYETSFIAASVVLLLAPASWMIYNAAVFGDWLDFMRGPYSAKAIELRTASGSGDPHPGYHNPWVSFLYFLKAAQMDASAIGFGRFLVCLSLLGTAAAWLRSKTHSLLPTATRAILWTLLLWLPLPFYAYSVSFGSVPIFLPVWPPFSWYNTRYGMELLPAFALFLAFSVNLLFQLLRDATPRTRANIAALLFAALLANSIQMIQERPLTYIEGKKNTESRTFYNQALTQTLTRLHALDPSAIVLMNTSTFPSVIPEAGMTYRQTLNESDKQFYQAALQAPAQQASIIIAFAGEEIDQAAKAHPEHLRLYQRLHSPFKGWDQPDATVYVSDTFPLPAPAASAPPAPAR